MEMATEIDYDPIKPEVKALENGDVENVTDYSIDEGKTVSESADVKGSDCLEEESTNMNKQEEDSEEEVEGLKDVDVLEGKTGETTPPDEIVFVEGPAKKSGAFVIGVDHKFPVRSRYLGGSFASCHDLCKFGHKSPESEKNTRPLFGMTREPRPWARTSGDNLVRAQLNEGTKKKKDGGRLLPPGSSKGEKNFSPSSFNQQKFKHVQSEIKPSSVPFPKLRNRSEARTGKKIVGRSSSAVENVTPKVKEIKTGPKKETVSHEKEKAKENAKGLMNGSISPLKQSTSIEARRYKNLKHTSQMKKKIVSSEGSEVELRTDRKSVKRVSKVAPLNEASRSTARWSRVSKNNESKDGQTEGQNGLSFSPSEPTSLPSTKGTQKKSELISPKPVRKVKSENRSRPVSPKAKSSVDSRMIPRRRGSVPEEKDALAWKMKFKRGTVVALQSSNSSPRKLKFKRGKMLVNEDMKGGIACELNRHDDTGNEPNAAKPEPPKVQLRHQETSGKKDNVDLNNVIEETATKLAKTRKSKVKALVGAFESVMTIHESRLEAGAS